MVVSSADLRQYLDGHRRAERVLRAETLRRLASLTVEQSRDEYDSLCQVWDMSGALEDPAGLDRREIQERVALRRRISGRR
jgi:hypothetical protein